MPGGIPNVRCMMNRTQPKDIADAILQQAKSFGADLAGITYVKALAYAPSFVLAPDMADAGEGIGTRKGEMELAPGQVKWPDSARSVVVIAVSHPETKPELDWWYGRKSPSGNRILMDAAKQLCDWVKDTYDIEPVHLPYHIEHGGTFLKDSAVMAGLGCVGKNNLLVTPEFGPRVRLRAITLDRDLPVTGPVDFDPCKKCDMPCRRACPQGAFKTNTFKDNPLDLSYWPGRTGHYARPTCNIQMTSDNDQAEEIMTDQSDQPVKLIKYCRACELACPVGKR